MCALLPPFNKLILCQILTAFHKNIIIFHIIFQLNRINLLKLLLSKYWDREILRNGKRIEMNSTFELTFLTQWMFRVQLHFNDLVFFFFFGALQLISLSKFQGGVQIKNKRKEGNGKKINFLKHDWIVDLLSSYHQHQLL